MRYLMVTHEESMVGRTRYFAVIQPHSGDEERIPLRAIECKDNRDVDAQIAAWGIEHRYGIHTYAAIVVYGHTNMVCVNCMDIQRLTIADAFFLEVGKRAVQQAVEQFIDDELKADAEQAQANDYRSIPPTDPQINIQ